MYNKTIFESADEFFVACSNVRAIGDKKPSVPSSVYVVFDGEGLPTLSGESAKEFGLHHEISQSDMIKAAFDAAGSRLHYEVSPSDMFMASMADAAAAALGRHD
ncbi:MAG: hypothetical protein GY799_12140 [Desulfobulbaceae bacterium]|nr:hypothetical protein [Desulfobulbaceae bacterium]